MSDYTIPIEPSMSQLRSIAVEALGPASKGEHAKGDVVRVGSAEGNDLVIADGTVSRFQPRALSGRRSDPRHGSRLDQWDSSRRGRVSLGGSMDEPGATVSLGQAQGACHGRRGCWLPRLPRRGLGGWLERARL